MVKTVSKTPEKFKKPSKTESPARHFEKPQQVVTDETLTSGQKLKALDTWEADAQALQRAEDEGMSGGESSKLIDVVAAKKHLAKKIESKS